MERVKRTYNLTPDAVAMVKELVDRQHLASSQDALVEMAIRELGRWVRDRDDAEAYARLAQDPVDRAEVKEWEALLTAFSKAGPEPEAERD